MTLKNRKCLKILVNLYLNNIKNQILGFLPLKRQNSLTEQQIHTNAAIRKKQAVSVKIIIFIHCHRCEDKEGKDGTQEVGSDLAEHEDVSDSHGELDRKKGKKDNK